MKIVGLDCEFTNPRWPDPQCTAVLQLSVAYETLVFQIVHADEVPQVLKDFLADETIYFCGVAIGNDVKKLKTYGIIIPSAIDLQKILVNPTQNNPPLKPRSWIPWFSTCAWRRRIDDSVSQYLTYFSKLKS